MGYYAESLGAVSMSITALSARSDISTREKLILVGLYLSKYDQLGLEVLGFDTFVEAYNVIGFALRSRPASIKNYRDEFDPLFPNRRKGWHKRGIRDYCLAVFERYKELEFESFTGLVKSFFGYDENLSSGVIVAEQQDEVESSFAQRLITGLAAEHYFESVQAELPEFSGYLVENTTRLGCGYDFRLRIKPNDEDFLAVEVKGIKGQSGSLSMTPKEYDLASMLKGRFFLFVVRNFRETPLHQVFRDPLAGSLHFKKIERVTIQVSWFTRI
jgi:hypothetical protein